MLETKNLSIHYGRAIALASVDLKVKTGEFVSVIGANGAGKSTLLRAISGLIELEKGKVLYNNEIMVESTKSQFRSIGRNKSLQPNEIVKRGIIHCPERRKLFPRLTLEENLMLGAYVHNEEVEENAKKLEEVLDIFPDLRHRLHENAGNFSGGQQQMIAIARSLMSRPKLLMLDEPSLGLAPIIRADIMDKIRDISKQGTTILLIEQDANLALSVSDRAYLLEDGAVEREGPCKELLKDEYITQAYLGFN
ncbi:MAG: High-affinity branched-chain amino acid transport ATP-binding protein LivF [Candidatus Heimdallarchaeota archaeon LC_2]|nr:MAG: High-affinity branched-chain amino acid transport ATP-binding protein LivF [Candidatus Heimdallarchaeota archaeon LC_2]